MATWYAQHGDQEIAAAWSGHPTMWNSAANGSGSWLTWSELGASDSLDANSKTGIALNSRTVLCGKLTNATTGYGSFTSMSSSVLGSAENPVILQVYLATLIEIGWGTLTVYGSFDGANADVLVNGIVIGGNTLIFHGNVDALGMIMTRAIYDSAGNSMLYLFGNVTASELGVAVELAGSGVYVEIVGNVTACGIRNGIIAAGGGGSVVKIRGNVIDSSAAAAVVASFAQYDLLSDLTNHFDYYDWNGVLRHYPIQLSAEDIRKNIVSGVHVGVLPPASPFRRTQRFV